MRRNPLKLLGGAIATAVVALMLVGCRGATGQAGANGANGTNGNNGTNGTNGSGPVINAAVLTPTQWSQLTFQGSIQSVTMGGAPVVNFTVTDGFGVPIAGMGLASKSSTAIAPTLNDLAFTIAKLVPGTNGSPSKWVNYIVTTMPASASASVALHLPGTDNTGTLVDHGNGTYTYTFYRDITTIEAFRASQAVVGNNDPADLGDVSYQPSLTHRIGIQIGGSARGTGKNTPDGSASATNPTAVNNLTSADLIYDFIPATGQKVSATDAERIIVDIAACNTCHTKLTWHGANRVDTLYCVLCHNDQQKYGFPEAATTPTGYSGETRKINGVAVGNFPRLIHMIHTGEQLKKTGYAFSDINPFDARFPQDLRNCTKCHTGTANSNNPATPVTPQGDNWKNAPSRLACGACHDNVDWATGANHGTTTNGGPQLSDQNCVNCHTAAAIATYHTPIVPPNPAFATGGYTNGASLAAYSSNLPTGAIKVTWDLKNVSLNASSQPVFVFRFLQDGQRVDFNTYSPTGKKELWDNFVGGPSAYLAFAVPQDGIQAPADWNATVSTYVKKVWNGAATGASAGSLTGPDPSGYYTLTLTGVKIPATATMLTGGIGYTYNKNSQPITQTNVPGYPYNTNNDLMGGLSVPPPNVTKPVDPAQVRRAIVSNQKCNSCHAVLGVFTETAYHAGERNDAPTCTFCHNVNRVNSGWGVNQKDFVHALHAASKRNNKFSWEASAGDDFWNTTYPGSERSHMLNNCEACHVPGSYDFSASANAAAVPNLLWTTVATGKTDPASFPIITGNEVVTSTSKVISPFITPGVDYGSGYSFNLGTGAATNAAGTTLVNSPITSACSSCHDSVTARAHMTNNGGVFYSPRSAVIDPVTHTFNQVEQCLVCHGTGTIADIKTVHMTFK